jgi:hypothetical protein
MPVLPAQDLALLRSLASRGDKMAAVMIRAFDTLRSADREHHIARCATTADHALEDLEDIDGVTPEAGDVILVKSQTDLTENGLYVAADGAWTRKKDDQGSDVITPGMLVQVLEGTTLEDTLWAITTDSIVLGTDDIEFAQMLEAAVAGGSITPASINGGSTFVYEQDFPLAASGTIPPPLAKDGQTAGSTGDYLADVAGGVYSLATDATSEAQAIQLTFGNQLIVDPTKGPIFEARVRLNIPGATPSADERWVVGLCSDHTNAEDALDAVVSNAWFRGEGANLNIFAEGDDGTNDDDDNDTTIDYVDNTFLLLKIDMTDLDAVTFSINGTVRATIDLGALTGSTLLQPIFCYQRDAGAEINLLQVDWFKITQSR